MALAALGESPALEQQPQFVLATDQRNGSARVSGIKPTFRTPFAGNLERAHRLGEAGQCKRTDWIELERPAQKAPRAFGDHDPAGGCDRLQACREIGSIAHDRLLLGGAAPDEVADDHQSRRNPYARRELVSSAGKCRNGPGDRDAGPDRALGLILVRPGPAEVRQHAVPHELGDVAFEPCHFTRDRVLIDAQDVAHLLGVQLRRERCRAHHVDEHDRELAPLDVRCDSRRDCPGLRCHRTGEGAKRPQKSLACTQRQPQLPQVGVRELGQHVAGDPGLEKRLRILLQPEFSQPGRDFHAGSHLSTRLTDSFYLDRMEPAWLGQGGRHRLKSWNPAARARSAFTSSRLRS